MARKDVLTSWDRDNRNNMQDNFIELYGVVNDIVGTITEEVYEQIIDGSKLDWKEPVNSFDDLPTEAVEGETRMTRETGKVYRYDDYEWKEIQEIDATAVNEVDRRLSSQLAEIEREIDMSLINTNTNTVYPNLSKRLNKDYKKVSQEIKGNKTEFNNKINDISVNQINKNKGKLDETFMSNEFLQQMAGNSPIHAMPSRGSLTREYFAEKSLTADKTDFMERTKNLFGGYYDNFMMYGLDGDMVIAENMTGYESAQVAIVPIKLNKTYVVEIHEPELSNFFRIGSNQIIPNESDFGGDGRYVLNTSIKIEPSGYIYRFTNNSTDNYAFILVSGDGKQPKMQVEEIDPNTSGTPRTEYIHPFVIKEDYLRLKNDNGGGNNKLKAYPKTLLQPETLKLSYYPISVGVDGYVYGFNPSGIIHRTGDGYSTVEEGFNFGYGRGLRYFTKMPGGYVAVLSDTTDNTSEVYYSNSFTEGFAKVLDIPNGIINSWGISNPIHDYGKGVLLLSEYAQDATDKYVYITWDGGASWEQLKKNEIIDPGERCHWHNATFDHINERIYVSQGDNANAKLWYSDDFGDTWEEIIYALDTPLQPTFIGLFHDKVVYSPDRADYPVSIWQMDKDFSQEFRSDEEKFEVHHAHTISNTEGSHKQLDRKSVV